MSWASSAADPSGSAPTYSETYGAARDVHYGRGGDVSGGAGYSSSSLSSSALQRQDALKKREAVMTVFCKNSSRFENELEYAEYLERAEGIVFRLLQDQDTESARRELEAERERVGAAVIQEEAERRRADEDKRRRAQLLEPTWGLGLPSKRKQEGSSQVDLDRARAFYAADEKRRRLLTTGEGDADSADPAAAAKRKQRNKERAGGYDHEFDAQHGLDDVAHSISCF